VGKKKVSKVLTYFCKIKKSGGSFHGDGVECTECKKTVKTKTGNATNLMCHLSNKHPKKYAEVKQKMEEEK